ncbi:MAG: hypothetical protein GWP61_02865 [Chloroflexi bacterium]|nr:hypothetical protein [Chloroflexota bacterium]
MAICIDWYVFCTFKANAAAGGHNCFVESGLIILDPILVSPALFRHFTAVDVLHFNADYPESYEDDATTDCRVSDHDPLEA